MQTEVTPTALRGKPQAIRVRSPEFDEGRAIPREFTFHGDDVSPPLEWSGVPEVARSIVIIANDPDAPPDGGPSSRAGRHPRDPDAPSGTFTHWLVWNLPPRERGVAKGAHVRSVGAEEGTNDFGVVGWRGPKPPGGTHRYFFRVIALDDELDLDEGARAKDVWGAIAPHVLAWGETMGTFTKP